jgi:hypothetical protein
LIVLDGARTKGAGGLVDPCGSNKRVRQEGQENACEAKKTSKECVYSFKSSGHLLR